MLHNGQPKTCAARLPRVTFVHSIETLEDTGMVLDRDANANTVATRIAV